MTLPDRRLLASNGRVAHLSVRGQVAAERFVAGEWARVADPVADLLNAPQGRRDRQLLWGERFLVLEQGTGLAFGRSDRDGHVGYLAQSALGPDHAVTHRVAAPATHLYSAPDIKSPEVAALSLGAQLCVVEEVNARFVVIDQGLFALRPHLRLLVDHAADPVEVAQGFLGTPYLWGGNSRAGIDCSGLVQASLLACGIACPSDSDLQRLALGRDLPADAPLLPADLLFWQGHVALVVDPQTLIHAVGHFMDVRQEPVAEVIARNIALGAGPVTARKRLA